MLLIRCKECKEKFPIWNYEKGRAKFCSRKCRTKWQKGKSISVKTQFKKGSVPVHKGKNFICSGSFKKGEKHRNWKGGKIIAIRGYIYAYSPNHPFKNCRNYVMEHRLIMEKHIDRYLEIEEVVHHINGITNDNRIENLMYFANNRAHLGYHRMERKNRQISPYTPKSGV